MFFNIKNGDSIFDAAIYHQVLTNGVYRTPLGLCMSTKPEERDASWSHWRFAVDRTKTSQRSYGSQDVANQDGASEASGNPAWLTCTQLWNYSFIYIYIPFSYYLKNTLSMYHQKSYLFFRVVGCCWIWGDTLLAQSKGLETTFFEMKHYLDQYKEDSLVELGWAMSFHPFQCNSHHLCCRNLSCVHYRKTFYG